MDLAVRALGGLHALAENACFGSPALLAQAQNNSGGVGAARTTGPKAGATFQIDTDSLSYGSGTGSQ